MNCKRLSALILVIGLMLYTSIGFGAQDDSGPSAFFPQTLYEYSPVLDGTKVEHEFVVQNNGTATLLIERVKTG